MRSILICVPERALYKALGAEASDGGQDAIQGCKVYRFSFGQEDVRRHFPDIAADAEPHLCGLRVRQTPKAGFRLRGRSSQVCAPADAG